MSGGGKRRRGDTAFDVFFKEEDVLINQFKVKCLNVSMSNVLFSQRRKRNLSVIYLAIPQRLMSGNQGHSCVFEFSIIWFGFRS